MRIFKDLKKRKGRKSKNIFLHSTFLNKDFLLDIVRKYIKVFTVILKSIVKGGVSHFFDIGLCLIFILCRRKFQIFFYNFVCFT